jgi:cell shape-determining protein MreC
LGGRQLRSWMVVLGLVILWPVVYLAHADRHDPGPLDRLVLGVTGPVFTLYATVNAGIADAWAERRSLGTARQDYYDLWQDHQRLRLVNMTLRARLDAVERLESLVQLRHRFEHHEWAAARVIAIGAGQVAPILTVDAGDESRVKVGDLAVDDRGVVGRVRSVRAGTSEILPLSDPMSLVGFRGELSGAAGMINGDGSGGLVAVGVDPGQPPKIGELLVSRTLESPLPEGLPIGHVRSLETEETTGRLLVWITPVRNPRQVGPLLIAIDPERPDDTFRAVEPLPLGQVP